MAIMLARVSRAFTRGNYGVEKKTIPPSLFAPIDTLIYIKDPLCLTLSLVCCYWPLVMVVFHRVILHENLRVEPFTAVKYVRKFT